MRTPSARVGLTALTLMLPAAVVAAPALRGIMHGWRDDARSAHAMLDGSAAFDQAALGRTLQGYAADAGRIAAQLGGHSAAARDLRARFITFQADSRAAVGDLGQRDAIQADYARLLGECRSCHDKYNN